jgi:type II secretory pathway pseudopilin PulG
MGDAANFCNYDNEMIMEKSKGQSLVELMIAVAIGAILILAIITLIVPALKGSNKSAQIQTASSLAKELLENVGVWSQADWHNIYDLGKGSPNFYYLNTSNSPFVIATGTESIEVGTSTYSRFFYIENVSRDSSGNIVTTDGADDPSTQKVTVGYNWPQGTTSTISSYLTRSRTNIFIQTDWSGGFGQDGPVTSSNSMFSTSSNINFTTSTGSFMINL